MKQCPFHILKNCDLNCALFDEATEACSIALGADALCYLADAVAEEIKQEQNSKSTMTVKRFFELQEELTALYKVQLVIDLTPWCCFDYDEIRLTTYIEFIEFINEEFNSPQKIIETAILSNSGYFRFVGVDGWKELPFHIKVINN